MNNPFKELVDRRLWPIALVLVAALVAVPMVLKEKTTEPTAVATAPIAAGPTGASGDDSVVEPADATRTDVVRTVLGDRKDPFRPAQVDRVPKPEVQKSVSSPDAGAASGSETGGSAGGESTGGSTTPTDSGTGTTTPEVVQVPEDTTPQPTFELYSLIVSFGDVEGTQVRKNVERLKGLPGGNPAIMYLGLLADHKTAVFMVDATVKAEGDGTCKPTPKNCQTITMKVGDTEFFTMGDTTYQLDLDKIITKKTFDEDEAAAARKKTADDGGPLRHAARNMPYQYSAKTGILAKVATLKSHSSKKSIWGATLDTSG